MSHKTLIGGTAYDTTGGKCLVGGTGCSIQKGRTLVNGTGYDIAFESGVEIGSMAVGESVYLNVNGTAYEFLIVHQGNPDTSLYDSSCNGSWLLMKDIYEKRAWHSSNSNSYSASTIHSYLNSTFLNLFASKVKKKIEQVKIPYVNGTGDTGKVSSGANGLSAKIFLLSGYEIGFTQSYDNLFPIDGAKLDYFKTGAGSSAKKLRIAYMSGTATAWWLRSPNTYYDNRAWYILANGGVDSSGCTINFGIRPALVLPSTALFDPETFEFVG